MWTHFESIHITMQPTYQSMYFPGQGLLLAAGKVVFGDPWIALLIVQRADVRGDLLDAAGLAAAELGTAGRNHRRAAPGVFSYWTNTYHAAGSLAALGGALILGALPRLMKTARFRYAVLMGIGMAILALTRPYEGILLCLPVAIVLVRWMWKGKNRPSASRCWRAWPRRRCLLVIAAGAWMGYYDYRAFGNPLTPPYTVDRGTYAIAPYYVWQNAAARARLPLAEMRSFTTRGEMDFYTQIHSLSGFVPYTLDKVAFTFLFYAGFVLLLPLSSWCVASFSIAAFAFSGGLRAGSGGRNGDRDLSLPHYVAPFTAAFYAIGLQAMRHLRLWKPEGKPVGLAMVRFAVTVCVLLAGVRVFAAPLAYCAAGMAAEQLEFHLVSGRNTSAWSGRRSRPG